MSGTVDKDFRRNSLGCCSISTFVDVETRFGGRDSQIHKTGGLLHRSHNFRAMRDLSCSLRSVFATLDAILVLWCEVYFPPDDDRE